MHALIERGGRILVARERRRGRLRRSLPGGRVKLREGVADALRREVREETGLDAEPGRLLYVAEVRRSSNADAIVLVFEAHTDGMSDGERAELGDRALGADQETRWLGNIFDPRLRD